MVRVRTDYPEQIVNPAIHALVPQRAVAKPNLISEDFTDLDCQRAPP